MRVSPDEVETALRAVPGVREAAVLGRPDPAGGDAVVAFVTGAVRADEVTAALRRTQPSWLVPAQVEVVAALPLNPNGKPDLAALARRFAE
jgi:acyl-CoA synthetase (AMP-forming)/AMP-acid ligase II